jgi:hypothetical protein
VTKPGTRRLAKSGGRRERLRRLCVASAPPCVRLSAQGRGCRPPAAHARLHRTRPAAQRARVRLPAFI